MAWSSVCRVSASRSGQSWRNRHRSHVQKHVLDRLHPGPHRGVAVRRQPPPRPLRQWPHQPPADHRWPRPRVRVTSQQCEKSMLGHAYVLSLSLSLSDTCTGPTGTETGRRSSAPAWTGPTGRCWCRTAWGCPTDWPMTPRAASCAGPTQVRRYSSALIKDLLHSLKLFIWNWHFLII